MNFFKISTLTAALAAAMLVLPSVLPSARAAGLYDDDDKAATTGDLNDQDYWWTKFDAMMLELAIKQHQPEGRIGLQLVAEMKRLEQLSKKYPKHKEIAKWKARAEAVQGKIDPNADRNKYFGPECPWEESNFAQLWVNQHWAKVAFDAKDYSTALNCMQNVRQNYEIMLKPDRMKDYPEDLKKWVTDSKPESDKLWKAIKEKTSK